MSEWIDVNERLPENNLNQVLVIVQDEGYEPYVTIRYYQEGMFLAAGVFREEGVTHWMPLPEPPKGVVKNG